jgi:hypothetical protein
MRVLREVPRLCEVHKSKACLEVELIDQEVPVENVFYDLALQLFPRPDLCCPT